MTLYRQHYRILYPGTEHPVLIWDDLELKVLDLSESGACVAVPAEVPVSSPKDVCILFPDGREVATRATVVRTNHNGMAVTFFPCIPFALILAEQRRIRLRFRHLET